MRRPVLLAIALAVLTLSAPVAAVATPASAPSADAVSAVSTQDNAPSDPDSDVLGWENGYWYNESIDVDSSDGLDEDELDIVVSRAMARVEELRGLEFEENVPVEVYTREELRAETGQSASNSSAKDRLHQNVKYEAMFMVGESTDAVGVQQSNQGASIGGYYSPAQDRIVVVSKDKGATQVDESTLGHELVHALQDQHFDLESFNATTREQHNAHDGLVEGDANYVGYQYRQRCGPTGDDTNAWGTCLSGTNDEGSSNGSSDLHIGLYLVVYQPYSDGPSFVKARHDSGGWDAVNAMYEDLPASTEQTIHPEKYGNDDPSEITIEDRSNDEWNVLDLNGSTDHAEFGEAGLFSMFWYPSYTASSEAGVAQNVVIPYASFISGSAASATTGAQPLDPYNYSSPYTAGWDGDRLLPYVTEDSESSNETGYVWKMQWDSTDDATEFREGYLKLLDHHGATQVGQNTWLVEEGEYADAFHISVDGNTTTIVNAPTVQALSGVDSSISVQAVENGTTSAAGDGSDGSNDTGGSSADASETSGGSGPGFGVVAAVVALLAAALLARRE